MRTRVIFLKRQDIGDIGPAPAIDRLVRVTDDTQVLMRLREQFNERILGPVRILILVDVDVLELLLIKREHVRRFLEQLNRLHDQVIKVEHVVLLQLFLIRRIDVRDDFLVWVVTDESSRVLRRTEFVLMVRDHAEERPRLIFFRVKVQLFEHLLDCRQLIG